MWSGKKRGASAVLALKSRESGFWMLDNVSRMLDNVSQKKTTKKLAAVAEEENGKRKNFQQNMQIPTEKKMKKTKPLDSHSQPS